MIKAWFGFCPVYIQDKPPAFYPRKGCGILYWLMSYVAAVVLCYNTQRDIGWMIWNRKHG